MTDQKQASVQGDSVSKTSGDSKQWFMVILIVAFAVFWGVRNPSTALRVLAVMLGFGGIVMIHELGHFIVAKLGRIKVEAFSIGFPPVLFGIRKLNKGWRVRLLPKPGQEPPAEKGDNETEYQIGLIPIGGFVKMLGQSDTGAADACDDPRSYSNRPVSVRIATVAAGVIFNAIGAIVIFMILFTNGIDLKPAVVGKVVYNSPAYDAGIRPGDEIVEVNGERFIDFESVLLAPALSAPGEEISFVVRRPGGEENKIALIAEKMEGDPTNLRYTGISPATTLEIEPMMAKAPKLVEEIYAKSNVYPGDQVKAVNGQAVQSPWEFRKLMSRTFSPQMTLTVSRTWQQEADNEAMVTVELPMKVGPVVDNFRDEFDLAHFASLVPCLRVEEVVPPSEMARAPGRALHWIKHLFSRKESGPALPAAPSLQKDDVILKIADQPYPNFEQLRLLVEASKDKDLPVKVRRIDEQGNSQVVDVMVHPRTDPATKRVLMGISATLDMEQPVVAQVIDLPGQGGLVPAIPAGARITGADGQPVESFYDIARILQANPGKKIDLEYQIDEQNGGAAVVVSEYEPVHAEAQVAAPLPMADLTRPFKASNPVEATIMGLKKTWQFVSRSYVTLGRLFQRSVPVSALSGPVGIISMTYQVAGTSLDHYLYFLGLISSCLAVMNLLPLPVLDGGHIVLLIIEKITGKPVHEKILAPLMYAGMAFLLGLIVWITYHDLLRIVFG